MLSLEAVKGKAVTVHGVRLMSVLSRLDNLYRKQSLYKKLKDEYCKTAEDGDGKKSSFEPCGDYAEDEGD